MVSSFGRSWHPGAKACSCICIGQIEEEKLASWFQKHAAAFCQWGIQERETGDSFIERFAAMIGNEGRGPSILVPQKHVAAFFEKGIEGRETGNALVEKHVAAFAYEG